MPAKSIALILALAATACAGGSTVGEHVPSVDPSTSAAGSGPAEPSPSSSRARPAARGTLEVIVTDASGRRRPEIPVRITKPDGTNLQGTTDERGVVRERLSPGYYRVAVVTGCHGRMQVTFGGRGRLSLTPGSIVRAPMRAEAIRRYAAGPPLQRDREPPWMRGTAVDLRFRLYDRCTDQVMRNFAFDDLEYRPSGHLKIVDAYSRRTNADALGRVRVRCLRPGPATLILGDPANPDDGEDLLAFTPPLDPTAEWCA